MTQYYGLHGAKQFIKRNSVKFGYKLWMLCRTGGYLYSFEIYCGKDSQRKTLLEHVVMNMLSPISNKSIFCFFDKFFTSQRLLAYLSAQNIRAVGTIRDNRTANCPIFNKKEC